MIGQQRLPFPEGDDVGKGRFGQQELFNAREYEKPAPPPQAPRATHPMDARRPMSEGGALGTSWTPFTTWKPKVNPTADDWAAVGPSQSKQEWTEQGAHTKVHPGQFQMFMTPREIRSKYQALEGDRQYTQGERAGELTGRAETTEGEPNITINTAYRSRLARWHGGTSQVAGYSHVRNEDEQPETDDQLFARKLDEAQMDPGEYAEVQGGESSAGEPPEWSTLAQRSSAPSYVKDVAAGKSWNTPPTGQGSGTFEQRREEGEEYVQNKQYEHEQDWAYRPSLYDRIKAEGVLSPVHLSIDQMGHTYGKPEIVGGHHRLAVQSDIDMDQPIPVRHWKNFHEARSSGEYT